MRRSGGKLGLCLCTPRLSQPEDSPKIDKILDKIAKNKGHEGLFFLSDVQCDIDDRDRRTAEGNDHRLGQLISPARDLAADQSPQDYSVCNNFQAYIELLAYCTLREQ